MAFSIGVRVVQCGTQVHELDAFCAAMLGHQDKHNADAAVARRDRVLASMHALQALQSDRQDTLQYLRAWNEFRSEAQAFISFLDTECVVMTAEQLATDGDGALDMVVDHRAFRADVDLSLERKTAIQEMRRMLDGLRAKDLELNESPAVLMKAVEEACAKVVATWEDRLAVLELNHLTVEFTQKHAVGT